MAQYFVYWWSKIVLMSLRHADSLSDDPQTLNSSHSTLWRQWSMHHDMGMFLILRVGPIYRIPWISLSTLKYLKRLCYLMPKRKRPWNGCFNKTTTPNTPVSQQHLDSRPTRLTLCSGQPNLQTLIQQTTWGVTSKMLFLRQNQEMQRNCGIVLGWNTCSQMPDSMQRRCEAVPGNHAYTTKC